MDEIKNHMPIGLQIAILDRAIKQKVDERAARLGLTAVQLRVLAEISLMEASGITEINQRTLERAEKVKHPTMTGIIKRLESKGFVTCETSALDRRHKKISCTEKGRGMHREIEHQDEEILAELCRGFTAEQMQEFVRMTGMILANISW